MPSLSLFLKGRKGSREQAEIQLSNIPLAGTRNSDAENEARTSDSRRHFFRSLVMRSRLDRRSIDLAVRILSKCDRTLYTYIPDTTLIYLRKTPSSSKPPPLTEQQLRQLFSGAPQFLSVMEAHCIGPPHPTISFPWNSKEDIQGLCDHREVGHNAWKSISAWPQATWHVREPVHSEENNFPQPATCYRPQCRERPHMPSMQGLERGTIGYIAALELGVSDARPRTKSPSDDIIMAIDHEQLLNGQDGIRHFTESELIDRLISVSKNYRDSPEYHLRPAVDLFADLYSNVLFPPAYPIDANDPASLQVQIEMLVDILASPLWIDFSVVEWRMRLGEILWGPPIDNYSYNHVYIEAGIAQRRGNQKYWLLIQIILSCELLLRLDSKSVNAESGLDDIALSEIQRIDETTATSIRWSLLLARRWLDNIHIEVTLQHTRPTDKPTLGWLATLLKTGRFGYENFLDVPAFVQMQNRNNDRQLSGLLRFARELRWPNADFLAERIAKNEIIIYDSLYGPPATRAPPEAFAQTPNSYSLTYIQGKKKGQERPEARANFSYTGWISNSYISGLVLPGEGLGHFLICTLLDNDESATDRLGRGANLYSGFCYCNQSFWSTACIVGRVLAGGKGATECVGWISSGVIPKGFGDGWVDIDATPLPQLECDAIKPRVYCTEAIEHDSSVIGDAVPGSVLQSDFILPSDVSTQRPLSINLDSLCLSKAKNPALIAGEVFQPLTLGHSGLATVFQTYSAVMNYTLNMEDEEQQKINIPLRYNVYFVTAHPCLVSEHTEPLLASSVRPGSTIQIGHFLHKTYSNYEAITMFSLLMSSSDLPRDSPVSPLNIPSDGESTGSTFQTDVRVFVVDCTDVSMIGYPNRPSPSPHAPDSEAGVFGSDIEMLARSLCAYWGWNAIISRRGRGCLACAIREAKALKWRVVLRLA